MEKIKKLYLCTRDNDVLGKTKAYDMEEAIIKFSNMANESPFKTIYGHESESFRMDMSQCRDDYELQLNNCFYGDHKTTEMYRKWYKEPQKTKKSSKRTLPRSDTDNMSEELEKRMRIIYLRSEIEFGPQCGGGVRVFCINGVNTIQ